MLPWLGENPTEQPHGSHTTSLAKLVRDDVLAGILNGSLLPGQRINEPDVAARLNVSRVPVREALRELESSGVVISRKHSGVFVRQLGMVEVRDLYELRSLLDGFAGRAAAQLPKKDRDSLVRFLVSTTSSMKEALKSADANLYYAENLRFHWAIVEAAGNVQMAEIYRGIVQKLHISRLKNLSGNSGRKASIAEHQTIVRALRQGDFAQTELLMARHVDDALVRLEETSQLKAPT
ncbi:GntR family transcriptional regulator [Limnohabitans sp. 15K]|uniref:GntR family transcriptional regulator n=1 Tax=Limnohabitans sp. 15K TaxID=1100706 RepID=UPI000C1EA8FF|nr:GntR family transcriptional regulator [Limnohabitans sp. 15K]PIT82519.1 GntR family transcriptional regulator [Limnohabitans sp. 15K]